MDVCACFAGFVLIYVYVGGAGFHLGPVSLLFLLYFGTVAGLVRMFSKQVQIWFDASCMYVRLGQALPQCYAKADIVGFIVMTMPLKHLP